MKLGSGLVEELEGDTTQQGGSYKQLHPRKIPLLKYKITMTKNN